MAGIKANDGIKRFNGDSSIYESYLMGFLEDGNYKRLLGAMEQERGEEAFQAAHALKGVSGNLSMSGMQGILIPMVEELRVGNMEGAKKYMPQLQEQYDLVIDILTEMKK